MGNFINDAIDVIQKDILLHHHAKVNRRDIHLLHFAKNDMKQHTALFFTSMGGYTIYSVYMNENEGSYHISEYSMKRNAEYKIQEGTNV